MTEQLQREHDRLSALADKMYEALRRTQEYVDDDVLPTMLGWSLFEAVRDYEAYLQTKEQP